MKKARPVRLACPALMLLRARSVFTRLPPSVATRHLPPQAGGGAWCPLLLPLDGVSSVPLKDAKSRLAPARWLKPTPYARSVFSPLGSVSSVPLKNAKSRLTPARWLKPTPYVRSVFPLLGGVSSVPLKNAKSRLAPARWAEVHPTPPQCLHRLGAVIAVVSYQRRAGRESGRRNGVLRCRAVSPTRRAGGRRFPALGFSSGI